MTNSKLFRKSLPALPKMEKVLVILVVLKTHDDYIQNLKKELQQKMSQTKYAKLHSFGQNCSRHPPKEENFGVFNWFEFHHLCSAESRSSLLHSEPLPQK